MEHFSDRLPDNYRAIWVGDETDHYVVRDGCTPTLKKLIKAVQDKGGEVLSRFWDGVDSKVTLSCKSGHIWRVTARPVMYQDTWCPTCAFDGQWKGHRPERRRRSFRDVLALAAEAGVTHIGTVSRIRYATQWRCSEGHVWEEPARAILIRGSFCQRCEGRPAKMLQRARLIAENRGGRCLSDEYINSRTKLLWECDKGHTWHAPWKNVGINGSWCLTCANNARRKPSE